MSHRLPCDIMGATRLRLTRSNSNQMTRHWSQCDCVLHGGSCQRPWVNEPGSSNPNVAECCTASPRLNHAALSRTSPSGLKEMS
jgi:hypothetical protein